MAEGTDVDDSEPITETTANQAVPAKFSWQASEYIHHEKRPLWFVGLFALAALLAAYCVWVHNWTGLAVLAMIVVAVIKFGLTQPAVRQLTLDDQGLSIDQKLYRYDQFRSFSVMPDVAWHSIDLEPLRRFQPRLTIYFDDKDAETIISLLSAQLPRVDRLPDIIERLARAVKF